MRWLSHLWRGQSLRARITIVATTLFAFAVITGAILLLVLQRTSLIRSLDSQAIKTGQAVAATRVTGIKPTNVVAAAGVPDPGAGRGRHGRRVVGDGRPGQAAADPGRAGRSEERAGDRHPGRTGEHQSGAAGPGRSSGRRDRSCRLRSRRRRGQHPHPARRCPDRLSPRVARDGHGHLLHRRSRAASGGRPAQGGRRRSPRPAWPISGSPCRTPRTRSTAWPSRSTPCSTGSTRPRSGSARSSVMPRTSCARRSPRCASSSRSRSGSVRNRTGRPCSTTCCSTSIGSTSSWTTCWPWPGRTRPAGYCADGSPWPSTSWSPRSPTTTPKRAFRCAHPSTRWPSTAIRRRFAGSS